MAPVHLAGAVPAPFHCGPVCYPAQLQFLRWWKPTVCSMLSSSGNGVGRGKTGKQLRSEYTLATCSKIATVHFPHIATSIESLEDVQPILEQRAPGSLRSYSLREAILDEEIWAAAWLRAQSYKEDQPYARYIESHKRKFAEQEFTALKRRVSGKVGQSIKCICFIAVMDTTREVGDIREQVDPILHTVIGTVDISCREFSPGELSPNASRTIFSLQVSEMLGLRRYAYISNLCVSRKARRNGVASRLLKTADAVAMGWGLRDIYVHVLPNNLAAQRLYAKHSFHPPQTGLLEIPPGEPVLLCRSM